MSARRSGAQPGGTLATLRAGLRRRYRARLSHARVWRRELPTEIDFWADYLRTGGGQFPDEFRTRLDPASVLDDPLVADRLGSLPGDPVRILDVGAGPMTSLGKTHPSRGLVITAVDPLADRYDRLLGEAGIVPPVRTRACRGEELLEHFEPGSFDVVYARNALDHSEHPMRIVENMVRLLAPGGFVAIRHYRNEGETMTYEELHQWNFEIRDGHLRLWSPRADHDLTRALAGRADVEAAQHAGSYHADWITAVIIPDPTARAEAVPGTGAPSSCPLCGAWLGPAAPRLPGRRCCASCGTQVTDPWPSNADLSAAYGPWYRPAQGRFGALGDALLTRSRGTLARRIDAAAPPGAILDVGSGDGTLLRALRARGRRATGLEREAGDDPDVHPRTLAEMPGPWAAIVLWHALEHLPDPGATLDAAAQALPSGGLLVVAVPNAASLQARAFGPRWLALDLPRHLVHLPADALLSALRQRGLRPERVSGWRGGQVAFGWLHGLVGLLPGHPDLYDAIRFPDARRAPMTRDRRTGTLVAGAVLAPLALALAGAEVALGRSGTVYVEARR